MLQCKNTAEFHYILHTIFLSCTPMEMKNCCPGVEGEESACVQGGGWWGKRGYKSYHVCPGAWGGGGLGILQISSRGQGINYI